MIRNTLCFFFTLIVWMTIGCRLGNQLHIIVNRSDRLTVKLVSKYTVCLFFSFTVITKSTAFCLYYEPNKCRYSLPMTNCKSFFEIRNLYEHNYMCESNIDKSIYYMYM